MTKVLISLPDDLLERVDREARARGDTRSGFLQVAARQALGWSSPTAIAAALERGRAALRIGGRFESAEVIAEDRKARDAADRRRR